MKKRKTEKNKINLIKNIFLYIFSFAIILFLLKKIGFSNIKSAFDSINYVYLIPITALFIIFVIVGGINLWILLLPIKKYNPRKIIKYYLISWSFGLLIPARVGELYILRLLKKNKLKLGVSTAIFTIDKIITLSIMVVSCIITSFIIFPIKVASIISFALFFILISGTFFLYNEKSRYFIKKYILKKHSTILSGFGKTSLKFLNEKKIHLFINFIFTLGRYFINSFAIYLTFLALGYEINIFLIVIFLTCAQILSYMPFTINGMGLKEALYIYLYGSLNIPANIVLARSIIDYVILYLIAALTTIIMKDQIK